MRSVTFALLLAIFSSFLFANEQKTRLVSAYSYHLKPPYIIDLESETGLYFDLVNYINSKSKDLHFHLTFLPRKRLDIYLERKQLNGIVVGVNPVWFKDREKQKYLWTKKIFDDRDDVVSTANSHFEYQGPSSLFGKSIGGVLGYYYFGINEAVASGKLKRADANSERALLEMIYHQRVFAGIVTRATFNYLVIKHGWQGRFHQSELPHDSYQRQIMVPRQSEEIFNELSPIIDKLLTDTQWLSTLKKYQIE